MTQPGYEAGPHKGHTPNRVITTPPPVQARRKPFPWGKALLAGGALAALFALSQCPREDEPAPEPEDLSWQDNRSIVFAFNTKGAFFTGIERTYLLADQDVLHTCYAITDSKNGDRCFTVTALDLTYDKPQKTCVGLGVDFARYKNDPEFLADPSNLTDHELVQAPTMEETEADLRAACATMPGNCALGRVTACTYR